MYFSVPFILKAQEKNAIFAALCMMQIEIEIADRIVSTIIGIILVLKS